MFLFGYPVLGLLLTRGKQDSDNFYLRSEPQPWMDKLRVLQRLTEEERNSARIFKFVADPPTTTLQRLKVWSSSDNLSVVFGLKCYNLMNEFQETLLYGIYFPPSLGQPVFVQSFCSRNSKEVQCAWLFSTTYGKSGFVGSHYGGITYICGYWT